MCFVGHLIAFRNLLIYYLQRLSHYIRNFENLHLDRLAWVR